MNWKPVCMIVTKTEFHSCVPIEDCSHALGKFSSTRSPKSSESMPDWMSVVLRNAPMTP